MDLTELRRTISLCKEGISSTTLDLTKLTGRSYDKSLDSNRSFSNTSNSYKDNFTNNTKFAAKRRTSYENENTMEIKKSRLDKEAPSLNSVVQMTKGRTRNDALHDLKTKENPKEKERCKRLFGHLMGTLNSIKKEAEKSSNDPQQITRMKIEKKVEEDHKIISATIQREQNELMRTKRDMQNDLKSLNQRYRAAEAFERWRAEKEKMKGYIRTTKLPFIFYKPKYFNEETQLRIDQTAREINLLIDTRKKKLEIEIERVVKRHLETSGHHKPLNGTDMVGIKMEDSLHGSLASVIVNNFLGQDRNKSPAHSFASEDYDDMIEEIEITMHDEPVVVHDEEERNFVMDGVDVVKEKCVGVSKESGDGEEERNVAKGGHIVIEESNIMDEGHVKERNVMEDGNLTKGGDIVLEEGNLKKGGDIVMEEGNLTKGGLIVMEDGNLTKGGDIVIGDGNLTKGGDIVMEEGNLTKGGDIVIGDGNLTKGGLIVMEAGNVLELGDIVAEEIGFIKEGDIVRKDGHIITKEEFSINEGNTVSKEDCLIKDGSNDGEFIVVNQRFDIVNNELNNINEQQSVVEDVTLVLQEPMLDGPRRAHD